MLTKKCTPPPEEDTDREDGGIGKGCGAEIVGLQAFPENGKTSQVNVASGSALFLRYYIPLRPCLIMPEPRALKKRKEDDPPNRRGPRGWVTLPKFVHLEGEIPAFQRAQAAGELPEFWPNMHVRFSAVFPLPSLTAEEVAAGVKQEDKLCQELKVS